MDPIGFSLENFDAVGRFRTVENGNPIDNSGQLTDGRKFNGAEELLALVERAPATLSCVTGHMATFALGREIQENESCEIQRIADQVLGKDQPLSELVAELVQSPLFSMQGDRP